jgi:hypothetical protein
MGKVLTIFYSLLIGGLNAYATPMNYQLDQSLEIENTRYPITWVEPFTNSNHKQISPENQKEGHRQIEEAFKALIEQYKSYGVVKYNDYSAQDAILKLADNKKSYTIVVWEPNKPRVAENVIGMMRIYISSREKPIPLIAKLRSIPRGVEEMRIHPGLYDNPKAVEAAHLVSRAPNLTMAMLGALSEKVINDIGRNAIVFAETIRQDSDKFSDRSEFEELKKLPKSPQEKLYERVFMFKPQNLFVDPSFKGRVTSVLVTTSGQLQKNLNWINAKGSNGRTNIVRLDRTEAVRQLNDFEHQSELMHRLQRKKRISEARRRRAAPSCNRIGFGLQKRRSH